MWKYETGWENGVLFFVEEDSVTVKTSLGNMNISKAERIFLNQGGVRLGVKGRPTRCAGMNKRSMFEDNVYLNYCKPEQCCSSAKWKGGEARLRRCDNSAVKVKGIIAFIAISNYPLRYACKDHSKDGCMLFGSG